MRISIIPQSEFELEYADNFPDRNWRASFCFCGLVLGALIIDDLLIGAGAFPEEANWMKGMYFLGSFSLCYSLYQSIATSTGNSMAASRSVFK
ncbi:hypothetical protein QT971_10410 [Microcoleus sp. herbarium19]|uniref:hypothetical protein n=1 Tax=Microcoleus sp. herbarium13 TaxID=3055438 RepID=UPI002FD2CFBF